MWLLILALLPSFAVATTDSDARKSASGQVELALYIRQPQVVKDGSTAVVVEVRNGSARPITFLQYPFVSVPKDGQLKGPFAFEKHLGPPPLKDPTQSGPPEPPLKLNVYMLLPEGQRPASVVRVSPVPYLSHEVKVDETAFFKLEVGPEFFAAPGLRTVSAVLATADGIVVRSPSVGIECHQATESAKDQK